MIYVHVPFCQSRCIYCDFYSTTYGKEIKSQFVEALCREISSRRDYLPSPVSHTLYFGGGTPSLLSIDELSKIISTIRECFTLTPDVEITIEANPDDVTLEWVTAIKSLGINRVSLGIQSFDDNLLKLLNRRHSAKQAIEAVENIAKNGINNISIDLIYGLPHQTRQSFSSDLRKAFSLPITHLSSYALSVEEHTVLARKLEAGAFLLPNEYQCFTEYDKLMREAELHNFEHYEISNFSLSGYRSRHNSGYWNGTPYLGLGPGAHSYNGENRRKNLPDLKAYIQGKEQFPHTIETLSREEKANEMIFTSLRTKEGLSLEKFKSNFGNAMLNKLIHDAMPHIKTKGLMITNNCLCVPKNMLFVSDNLIADLMNVSE